MNSLTVVAVLTGIIMIFAVPHQSADGLVSETPISAFRFFTTDSNVLAGIFAIIALVIMVTVAFGISALLWLTNKKLAGRDE